MKTWVAGLALAGLFFASSVEAAPQYVIDQNCRRAVITDCVRQSGGGNMPTNMTAVFQFGGNASTWGGRINQCAPLADHFCVVAVDVPTTEEVRALVAEGNRQQREQWAAWLKTLEETGVVKPPQQPQPGAR